jgi:hypothetical protein
MSGFFGFPPHSRRAEIEQAKREVTALVLRMLFRIGPKETAAILEDAKKSLRPVGRPIGSIRYNIRRLVDLYDAVLETHPQEEKGLATKISRFAHDRYPGVYGATPEGIAKNLRAALSARKKAPTEKSDDYRTALAAALLGTASGSDRGD